MAKIDYTEVETIAIKLLALGRATLAEYEAGRLDNPSLLALCQDLIAPSALPLVDADGIAPDKVEIVLPPSTSQPIEEIIEPVEEIVEPIEEVVELVDEPDDDPTTCTQCQSPLRPGMRFCTTCGLQVMEVIPPTEPPQQCSVCGTGLPMDALFCTTCGVPITEPPPAVVLDEPTISPDKYCDTCGLGVSADTMTCPSCQENQFS